MLTQFLIYYCLINLIGFLPCLTIIYQHYFSLSLLNLFFSKQLILNISVLVLNTFPFSSPRLYTSISVFYCLQSAFHCLQSALHCLQSTLHCLQSTFYCLQSTLDCLQNTLHCFQNALQGFESALHCLQNTFYCLQNALQTIKLRNGQK